MWKIGFDRKPRVSISAAFDQAFRKQHIRDLHVFIHFRNQNLVQSNCALGSKEMERKASHGHLFYCVAARSPRYVALEKTGQFLIANLSTFVLVTFIFLNLNHPYLFLVYYYCFDVFLP